MEIINIFKRQNNDALDEEGASPRQQRHMKQSCSIDVGDDANQNFPFPSSPPHNNVYVPANNPPPKGLPSKFYE